MKHTFRILGLALALTGTLAACSSGTKSGDTNVERGYTKKGPAAKADGTPAGDSVTAGLARDTSRRPTGQELLKASGKATDRNHDGVAD